MQNPQKLIIITLSGNVPVDFALAYRVFGYFLVALHRHLVQQRPIFEVGCLLAFANCDLMDSYCLFGTHFRHRDSDALQNHHILGLDLCAEPSIGKNCVTQVEKLTTQIDDVVVIAKKQTNSIKELVQAKLKEFGLLEWSQSQDIYANYDIISHINKNRRNYIFWNGGLE